MGINTSGYNWQAPVWGYPVSGAFGTDRGDHTHQGLDVAVPVGTPIGAFAAGEVIEARRSDSYGNTIVVRHGDGSTTRYAHLNSLGVSVGDLVNPGDPLGASGNTGRSEGPHLHFELNYGGQNVDPSAFFETASGENYLTAFGKRNDPPAVVDKQTPTIPFVSGQDMAGEIDTLSQLSQALDATVQENNAQFQQNVIDFTTLMEQIDVEQTQSLERARDAYANVQKAAALPGGLRRLVSIFNPDYSIESQGAIVDAERTVQAQLEQRRASAQQALELATTAMDREAAAQEQTLTVYDQIFGRTLQVRGLDIDQAQLTIAQENHAYTQMARTVASMTDEQLGQIIADPADNSMRGEAISEQARRRDIAYNQQAHALALSLQQQALASGDQALQLQAQSMVDESRVRAISQMNLMDLETAIMTMEATGQGIFTPDPNTPSIYITQGEALTMFNEMTAQQEAASASRVANLAVTTNYQQQEDALNARLAGIAEMNGGLTSPRVAAEVEAHQQRLRALTTQAGAADPATLADAINTEMAAMSDWIDTYTQAELARFGTNENMRAAWSTIIENGGVVPNEYTASQLLAGSIWMNQFELQNDSIYGEPYQYLRAVSAQVQAEFTSTPVAQYATDPETQRQLDALMGTQNNRTQVDPLLVISTAASMPLTDAEGNVITTADGQPATPSTVLQNALFRDFYMKTWMGMTASWAHFPDVMTTLTQPGSSPQDLKINQSLFMKPRELPNGGTTAEFDMLTGLQNLAMLDMKMTGGNGQFPILDSFLGMLTTQGNQMLFMSTHNQNRSAAQQAMDIALGNNINGAMSYQAASVYAMRASAIEGAAALAAAQLLQQQRAAGDPAVDQNAIMGISGLTGLYGMPVIPGTRGPGLVASPQMPNPAAGAAAVAPAPQPQPIPMLSAPPTGQQTSATDDSWTWENIFRLMTGVDKTRELLIGETHYARVPGVSRTAGRSF